MRMSRLFGLLSKVSAEPELLASKTLSTWNTYRYVGINAAWRTVGDWKQHYGFEISDNIVGYGQDGANSARIDVPALSFSKTAKRVRLTFNQHHDYNATNFRWAICTAPNNSAYQGSSEVPDSGTQLAHGTFYVPRVSSWNNIDIDMNLNSLPANTPFYIYLWASSGAGNNFHINGAKNQDAIYVKIYTK